MAQSVTMMWRGVLLVCISGIVLDMLRYCRHRQQGLISKQQHGFLARKSTVTNMLSCMNDWTSALMNKTSV